MTISFARHQFPPAIIRHAVWLYFRFTLSYRDVEDLLAERGLDVSYETVRRWVLKFGQGPLQELRRRLPVTHRRFARTTNLLERLFVEERRRLKIIPNGFGDAKLETTALYTRVAVNSFPPRARNWTRSATRRPPPLRRVRARA